VLVTAVAHLTHYCAAAFVLQAFDGEFRCEGHDFLKNAIIGDARHHRGDSTILNDPTVSGIDSWVIRKKIA